jgi:hypothetical protein
LTALLLAPSAGAAVYYVSTGGSDAAAGTSAAPFRSLQRGVDAARAGDRIVVRAGSYFPSGGQDSMAVTINKAGTAAAWITLESEGRWAAVLDCELVCHSFISLGPSAAYWVIKGFDIRRGRWAAIFSNSNGGKHILVTGNHIHNIGNRSGETQSIGITGVYIDESADDFRIDGNLFHDVGRSGLLNGLDHHIYTHGKNMLIVNNVFYGALNGRHVQSAAGFSGTIANNTFHGLTTNTSKLGHVMLWADNSNVVIRNNVMYEPRDYGIDTFELSMSGACRVENNWVYNPSRVVNLMKGIPSSCSVSGNRLNVDPKLVDPSPGGNFRPRSGSPVVDAGLPVGGVTADFDGVPRPQGSGVGVGDGATASS